MKLPCEQLSVKRDLVPGLGRYRCMGCPGKKACPCSQGVGSASASGWGLWIVGALVGVALIVNSTKSIRR